MREPGGKLGPRLLRSQTLRSHSRDPLHNAANPRNAQDRSAMSQSKQVSVPVTANFRSAGSIHGWRSRLMPTNMTG